MSDFDEAKNLIAVLVSELDQTQAQIDSMRKKFFWGWVNKRNLDKAQNTLNSGRASVEVMKFLNKILER